MFAEMESVKKKRILVFLIVFLVLLMMNVFFNVLKMNARRI